MWRVEGERSNLFFLLVIQESADNDGEQESSERKTQLALQSAAGRSPAARKDQQRVNATTAGRWTGVAMKGGGGGGEGRGRRVVGRAGRMGRGKAEGRGRVGLRALD